ncbi:MAG: CBS domain-containing protein [Candidatus Helarchaeota archaeon]
MNIEEIMNVNFKKFSIDKDRLVIDALSLMDKNKTSILLCIDNKKELKGIITERDLLDRLGSIKSGKLKTSSIRISNIMVYDPVVAKPDDSVYKVAEIMYDNGYTGIPIVDDKLVGFVSQNEMLKVCQKIKTITVDKIMEKNPIIISEDSRLIHARRILFEKDVCYILVGSRSSVKGVATEGVLARAFSDFREKVPGVHQEERLRQITIEKYCKAPFIIAKDTSIGEAADQMLNKGTRILVITDKSERLLGIVSKDILIRFIKNKLSLKNFI